jgi:predicted transcriptional regulator
MAEVTTTLTIRVSAELDARLREIAARDDRSLTRTVRRLLETALDTMALDAQVQPKRKTR